MSHCPSPETLGLYLGEQLDPPDSERVTGHVATCASCQATLERVNAQALGICSPAISRWRQRIRDKHLSAAVPESDFLNQVKQLAPPCASSNRSVTEARNGTSAASPAGWPRVPGYEILGQLGRGGMGVVYKARQIRLHRLVALKMLRAGLDDRDKDQARFRTEGEAVARLQHPNIVQIHDVGESEGRPYFALEFVEGGSLAAKIHGEPQPVPASARLVETLARAIHFAHQQGIIHRDLKPSNILLQNADCRMQIAEGTANCDGKSAICNLHSAIPKITDFGLAKDLHQEANLTASCEVLGTPSYMAPEQAQGKHGQVGRATDIYALGAILYELLTGSPPFRGTTAADTVAQVLYEEPVPPSRLRPKLPRDLETVCLKCLQKEPTRRYATAGALAEDLERFLSGESILARPPSLAERLRKWARRRPALATLTVCASLALFSLLGGILWHRADLESQLAQARLDEPSAVSDAGLASRTFGGISLLRTFAGHTGVVETVSFSPDGCRILSGGDDAALRLWDRDSGQCLRILCGHAKVIWSAAFSPDGLQALSGSSDGTLRLWDLSSGQELLCFRGHTDCAKTVAFSPDGRQILSAGTDMTIKLWDVASGRLERELTGHTGQIWSAVFSPDGRLILSGSSDGTLRLWNVADGREIRKTEAHLAAIRRVAFSRNGRQALSGGFDSSMRLWDLQTGRLLRQSFTLPNFVEGVSFSPSGAFAVSSEGQGIEDGRPEADSNPGVRLWDLRTGRLLARCGAIAAKCLQVEFSRDGRHVVTGGSDGVVCLLQMPSFTAADSAGQLAASRVAPRSTRR